METKNFNLFEGSFHPEDAKDCLLTIINNKINFNKIQILSITERDKNGYVKPFRESIEELKEAKKRIIELLGKAQQNGTTVEINNFLEIKIREKVSSNNGRKIYD